MKRAVKAGFDAARAVVEREKLQKALTLQNYRSVEEVLDRPLQAMQAKLRETVPPLLARVRDQAGHLTTQGLVTRIRTNALRTAAGPEVEQKTGSFNASSPEAQKWISDHAGDLINGISDTTRADIRALVAQAFEGDFDVDELADQIGDAIGDDDRAETIARTETMTASNEGQREAWGQAVDDGLLTGNETRVWIVTDDDRLCDECDALDGAEAELDGNFTSDTGDEYDGAPAHPNCRCTEGLKLSGEDDEGDEDDEEDDDEDAEE